MKLAPCAGACTVTVLPPDYTGSLTVPPILPTSTARPTGPVPDVVGGLLGGVSTVLSEIAGLPTAVLPSSLSNAVSSVLVELGSYPTTDLSATTLPQGLATILSEVASLPTALVPIGLTEDVSSLLSEVAAVPTQLPQVVPSLLGEVDNVLTGLVPSLVSEVAGMSTQLPIPTILSEVAGLPTQVAEVVASVLSQVDHAFTSVVAPVLSGVGDVVTAVVPSLVSEILGLPTEIVPPLLSGLDDVVTSAVPGAVASLTPDIGNLPTVSPVGSLLSEISGALPTELVGSILSEVGNVVPTNVPAVLSSLLSEVGGLPTALPPLPSLTIPSALVPTSQLPTQTPVSFSCPENNGQVIIQNGLSYVLNCNGAATGNVYAAEVVANSFNDCFAECDQSSVTSGAKFCTGWYFLGPANGVGPGTCYLQNSVVQRFQLAPGYIGAARLVNYIVGGLLPVDLPNNSGAVSIAIPTAISIPTDLPQIPLPTLSIALPPLQSILDPLLTGILPVPSLVSQAGSDVYSLLSIFPSSTRPPIVPSIVSQIGGGVGSIVPQIGGGVGSILSEAGGAVSSILSNRIPSPTQPPVLPSVISQIGGDVGSLLSELLSPGQTSRQPDQQLSSILSQLPGDLSSTLGDLTVLPTNTPIASLLSALQSKCAQSWLPCRPCRYRCWVFLVQWSTHCCHVSPRHQGPIAGA